MGRMRVKEYQRGCAYAQESVKERHEGAAEGSDTRLGPGDRAFKSHYSDPKAISSIKGMYGFFDIKICDILNEKLFI